MHVFQIERYIRMGIPPSLRGRVWKCLLGIDGQRETSDFNYQVHFRPKNIFAFSTMDKYTFCCILFVAYLYQEFVCYEYQLHSTSNVSSTVSVMYLNIFSVISIRKMCKLYTFIL